MPKDPSKQGHRGIGFVTYSSPESGAAHRHSAPGPPRCAPPTQRSPSPSAAATPVPASKQKE